MPHQLVGHTEVNIFIRDCVARSLVSFTQKVGPLWFIQYSLPEIPYLLSEVFFWSLFNL